jgi:hypothetical protein
MVKCGVPFEVRTEFLNIVWMRFCFKRLTLRFAKVQQSDWPGLDYRKSIPAMGWDFTRCHVVTHTSYPVESLQRRRLRIHLQLVPKLKCLEQDFSTGVPREIVIEKINIVF